MGLKTLDERVSDLEYEIEELRGLIDEKFNGLTEVVKEYVKRTPKQMENDIKLRRK